MSEQIQSNDSTAISTENQVDSTENQQENIENTEEDQAEASEDSSESEKSVEKKEKELKKALKKLKIKVDGKELEEELPFEIPDSKEAIDYMTRQLQMGRMGSKRAQEYAALEKDVRDFISELKKDPRKVLSDPTIGIDIKQLAAQIIEEEVNNSKKTPEQIEREKIESELKALKEEREREKEENRKRELERLQQQEFERYDMLITQALDKTDLPKSPYVVKKMADYMLLGLKEGIDIHPEDVVPLVRDEITNDIKEMFKVMPDEVIENLIGKDVLTRIRKKKLAKAKEAPPVPISKAIQDVGESKKQEKEATEKKTFRDFFGV